MSIEISVTSEVVWLDEHHEFSFEQFATLSGLTAAELAHLAACDMLVPVTAVEPAASADASPARFSARYLALARAGARLRSDFDLDPNGLTLALRLLMRVHELEAQLNDLRAQLPRSSLRDR